MRTKLLTSGSFILLLLGYFYFHSQQESYVFTEEKMKGLSFVAPSRPIDSSHFMATSRVNAEWISLMPYGFVQEGESEFNFSKKGDSTNKRGMRWWGEQPNGLSYCIEMARKEGLKVMLKPHMWLRGGKYTGEFDLASEAEWQTFETGFKAYLIQYAEIAEEYDVELFCIATEMEKMVEQRPDFWLQLIEEIRQVYSGPLTYAENWDCYDRVPFWEQLDYVGIDGYFPLSKKRNPSRKDLEAGWKKHVRRLDRFATKMQKPILFTEYGYRSCDFSANKPWETDYSLPGNEGLQARAYESFFEEVWQKPWFAGGFAWKWFPLKDPLEPSRDKFCPQHKEAENVLRLYYRG